VAKSSFADLKLEFDDACEFLRSFTLGRRGFTQRDGLAALERVSELCDRLKERFASGRHAAEAAAVVTSGRARVVAARDRLALLRTQR
jgi:hypothetical protein